MNNAFTITGCSNFIFLSIQIIPIVLEERDVQEKLVLLSVSVQMMILRCSMISSKCFYRHLFHPVHQNWWIILNVKQSKMPLREEEMKWYLLNFLIFKLMIFTTFTLNVNKIFWGYIMSEEIKIDHKFHYFIDLLDDYLRRLCPRWMRCISWFCRCVYKRKFKIIYWNWISIVVRHSMA